MPRRAKLTVCRVLAWLLIGLGAASFVTSRVSASRLDERVTARGDCWEAVASDGEILSAPLQLGGLTIGPGDCFRFRELPPRFQWQSARIEARKLESTSILEILLHRSATTEYVLGVVAEEPLGLFLAAVQPGAPPVILGRTAVPGALKNSYAAFKLLVVRGAGTVTVSLDGRPVLEHAVPDLAAWNEPWLDLPEFTTRNGPCSLRFVSITGASREAGGEAGSEGGGKAGPTTYACGLAALVSHSPWTRYAREALLVVLCLLASGLYLRAVCFGRPSPGELADAVAWAGLGAALPLIVGRLTGVDPGGTVIGLAFACGLAAGVISLRGRLIARAAPARPGAVGMGLAALTICMLCVASLTSRVVEDPKPADDAGAIPASSAPRAGAALPEHATLDAGNALLATADGPDVELSATAILSKDSVLEVRLRAEAPPHASGIALLLSSDPDVASSFVIETSRTFEATGSSAGCVAAGKACDVTVRIRGARCSASIDGKDIAATFEQTGSSGVALLAARGSVALSEITLTSLPAETSGGALVPAEGLSIAGMILVWSVVLGAALIVLGGFPVAAAALLLSLALLPVAVTGALTAPASDTMIDSGLKAGYLLAILLVLPVVVHAKRLRGLTVLVLLMVVLVTSPLLAFGVLTGGGDRSLLLPSSWNYVGWSGERMESELAYLRHPLIRRLNDYLAAHTFRGKALAAVKPAGTQRVLTLGGSSTWGFGIPEGEHKEYPALLETLLNDAHAAPHAPVEVFNGAYQGATGARLFRVLRDGLLGFQPDVVTLSLSYNDGFALTRCDEDALFDELAEPGRSRSVLGDARIVWDCTRGEAVMKQLLVRFASWKGSTSELWTAMGHAEADSPPRRFERVLRRFAELAAQRRFKLILIKEPLAGDRRFLWKDEFREVMDHVGVSCGIPVVDPTPLLEAAGGAALFQDDVHPRPGGHAVIASALLPVVRAALDAD